MWYFRTWASDIVSRRIAQRNSLGRLVKGAMALKNKGSRWKAFPQGFRWRCCRGAAVCSKEVEDMLAYDTPRGLAKNL